MNGQGRPNSHSRWLRHCVFKIQCGFIVLCCALGSSAFAQRNEIDLRLQITWNGPTPELWRGSIYVANGALSDMRILGSGSDQPGSYVIPRPENLSEDVLPNPEHSQDTPSPTAGSQTLPDRVLISPRFPSTHNGIDIRVRAPRDANLLLNISTDPRNAADPIPIPLQDLIDGEHTESLSNGHVLRVRRSPGDTLRLRTSRDAMVFAPGEKMHIDVLPHELQLKPGTTLRAKMRLRPAEEVRPEVALWKNLVEEDAWEYETTLRIDESGNARPITNIEVDIPTEPGVFNLIIDLAQTLPQVGSLAKRREQLLVVGNRRQYSDGVPTLLTEFNPAEPKWYEQLPQWTLLPRAQRGPWGSKNPEYWQHIGQRWTRLGAGDWMAYSLHVRPTGQAHVVDVEFPSDVHQDVDICVLEPNRGDMEPVAISTNIVVGDPDIDTPLVSRPQKIHHRIVFWPKSTSPVLLITNRSRSTKAAFGRIRLEAYHDGLPANEFRPRDQTSSTSKTSHRRRIAKLDAQHLRARFFPKTHFNSRDKVHFDDWRTFQEIAERLVDYLRFAGYDGIALNCASNGSTLYPSKHLHPTPSFDRGILATNGQDLLRKDVLEYLFRVFDQEGLMLIPVVEFASPLPELEAQLPNVASSVGIELVAYDQRGEELRLNEAAPYYNPLDARVQAAMRNVIQEIVERYEHHSSFGGVQIDFAGRGFAQLPGAKWAFDSTTLAAFHDSLEVDPDGNFFPPSEADETKKQLLRQLVAGQTSPLIEHWLRWRSDRLHAFYASLASSVGDDEGPQLYLSFIGLAESIPWQRRVRPQLSQETKISDTMQELGLDIGALQDIQNVVVLRPQPISSTTNLAAAGANMATRTVDTQKLFVDSNSTATVIQYQPAKVNLADSETLPKQFAIASQAFRLKAGHNARSEYAESLSQFDDQLIMEGGLQIADSQNSRAVEFFDVFRRLPMTSFETIDSPEASPLTLRKASHEGKTLFYAVNSSPWLVQSSFQWSAKPSNTPTMNVFGSDDFQSSNRFERRYVDVAIQPFSIVLFEFSSLDVALLGCRSELPTGLAKRLRAQLDDLMLRLDVPSTASVGRPLISDSGFESIVSQGDSAWKLQSDATGQIEPDLSVRADGERSLRMKAVSDFVSAQSSAFFVPATGRPTGRLTVSLQARASRSIRSPLEVRLRSVDGSYASSSRISEVFTEEFQEVQVAFLDLPSDAVELQLELVMISPGEIWIDDVRLHERSFTIGEQKALDKMLHVAYDDSDGNNLLACYETLTSYWPRFLVRHIKPVQMATRPSSVPPAPKPNPSQKSRFFDKWRRYVPKVPTIRFH